MVVALATIEVNAKAEPQPYWGHPYGLHPAYYFGPKCDEEKCDSCMKDFAKPVNCRRECLACKDCKGEETDDPYCDYCKDGYFACTHKCHQNQDECIGNAQLLTFLARQILTFFFTIACAPKCNMPKCDEAQCADCMEKFPEPIFAKNCYKECSVCKGDSEDEMCKDGFFACAKMCMKAQDQCLFCAPRCAKPAEEKDEKTVPE